MAGQQPIARAAAGLEAVARALSRRPAALGPGDAGAGRRRRSRSSACWCAGCASGATPTPRAACGSACSLESLGRPVRRAPMAAPRRPAGDLNTGVRAFVAREGALIASALDRAARALRAAPGDREPLYTVIRRMQSLRGLAELGELAPLPEILDGIELAVGDLTRLFAPPPGRGRGHGRRVGCALTRIARDIAEHGRPERRGRGGPPLHRAPASRLRRRARRGADRVAVLRRRSRAGHPAARRSRSSPPPRRWGRSSW